MKKKYRLAIGGILVVISIIQLIGYTLGWYVLLKPFIALVVLVVGIAIMRGRETIKSNSKNSL